MKIRSLMPPAKRDDLRLIDARSQCPKRAISKRPPCAGLPSAESKREEDRQRLAAAKRLLKANHPLLDDELLRGLIKTLRYRGDEVTLGSAYRFREIHINVTGAILRLLRDIPKKKYPAYSATILSRKWLVKPADLTVATVLRIIKEFRRNFRRGGTRIKGHLIARLDGGFDYCKGVFVLHFHAICTGEMASFLRRRVAKKPAYRGNNYIIQPVRVEKLVNDAYKVSYISKDHWVKEWNNGKLGEERERFSGGRIKEPYSTLYLSVLDAIPLSEIYVLVNVRIKNGSFVDNLDRK